MNATTTTDTARYLAGERIKSIDKFVKACQTWNAKCARLSAARDTPHTAEYGAALAAWSKGRMPSDRAKGHAYDAAEALRLHLALDVPHASTVDGLALVAAAARTAVAA